MTSLPVDRPTGWPGRRPAWLLSSLHLGRRFARPAGGLCVALGLALWAAGGAFAAPLQGKVLRVFDGDSIAIQVDGGGKPIEIRLKDIDAPEICQPGGPEARDFLQDVVNGKAVRVQTSGKDVYGRMLAVLTVDDLNINQRLVAEGHAWSNRTRWDRGPYVSQEKMAQALKRGLHATPGAVTPDVFRSSRGPCGGTTPAP